MRRTLARIVRAGGRLALVVALVSTAAAATVPGLDSDGDGLSDADERALYRTDPFDADSDDDALDDGQEVTLREVFGFVGFSEQRLIRNDVPRHAIVSLPADIDGDGDVDVVVGWGDALFVVWMENLDGRGAFGASRVIAADADSLKGAFVADLDGDGDLDVLLATQGDQRVGWYENLDGRGTFGPVRVIVEEFDAPRRLLADDLDGDGDLDVLATSHELDLVAWFENQDGKGTFGPARIVSDAVDGPEAVRTADLDADGDLDVLASALFGDRIEWFENADGRGGFVPGSAVVEGLNGAYDMDAADFDGDGDLDVVTCAINADTIGWHENLDGEGTFGPENALGQSFGAIAVEAVDVDGDADRDVLFVGFFSQEIGWFENRDGAGDFAPAVLISELGGGPISVELADADGDGDDDVFAAWWNRGEVGWFASRNGTDPLDPDSDADGLLDGAEFLVWHSHPLRADSDLDGLPDGAEVLRHGTDPTMSDSDGDGADDPVEIASFAGFDAPRPLPGSISPVAIATADLDGDGDVDVLSALADLGLLWHPNDDARGTFGPAVAIGDITRSVRVVAAVDTDGDGDPEAVVGSAAGVDVFENLGGAFAPARRSAIVGEVVALADSDLDGDGDRDLVVANGAGAVAWLENRAGRFDRSPVFVGVAEAGARAVAAGDLDGDGDADVVIAEAAAGRIAWYPNLDGSGAWGERQALAGEFPLVAALDLADMDGDGDLDVVSGSVGDDTIRWSANRDGRGRFDLPTAIWQGADDVARVIAADLDGDGDADVVAASRGTGALEWFENTDGEGAFSGARPLAVGAADVHAAAVADLDGDGDVDVLGPGDPGSDAFFSLRWYRNRGGLDPRSRDTDRDGVPDGEELTIFGTDPMLRDTDGDGLDDGLELAEALDPRVADSDGDGTPDDRERGVLWLQRPDAVGGRPTCHAEPLDLDRDGDLDLIAHDPSDGRLLAHDNRSGEGGATGFDPAREIASVPPGEALLAVADVDGDGIDDVVLAVAGAASWLRGGGDGGLEAPRGLGPESDLYGPVVALAVGDLDGDGTSEIVTASAAGEIAAYGVVGAVPARVTSGGIGAPAVGVWLADLDADGDLDIAVATPPGSGAALRWLENPGAAAAWPAARALDARVTSVGALAVADLDADGDDDLLAGALAGEVVWLAQTKAAEFPDAEPLSVRPVGRASWVATGDVDRDGDIDVVWLDPQGAQILVAERLDGPAAFSLPRVAALGEAGLCGAALADLDGDGLLDFATASPQGLSWHRGEIVTVPEPSAGWAAVALLVVVALRRAGRDPVLRARSTAPSPSRCPSR